MVWKNCGTKRIVLEKVINSENDKKNRIRICTVCGE